MGGRVGVGWREKKRAKREVSDAKRCGVYDDGVGLRAGKV